MAKSSSAMMTWALKTGVAAAIACTSGWKVNSERNQMETVSR